METSPTAKTFSVCSDQIPNEFQLISENTVNLYKVKTWQNILLQLNRNHADPSNSSCAERKETKHFHPLSWINWRIYIHFHEWTSRMNKLSKQEWNRNVLLSVNAVENRLDKTRNMNPQKPRTPTLGLQTQFVTGMCFYSKSLIFQSKCLPAGKWKWSCDIGHTTLTTFSG